MTLQKRSSKRPHYSDKERLDLEQPRTWHWPVCPEPVYAEKMTTISQGVSLSTCSKCKHVWYCSKACQKQDWNQGHKKICGAPIFIPDEQRAQLECTDDILIIKTHSGHIRVTLLYLLTGRFFETLTDCDVYFIPSEMALVPDKYRDYAVAVSRQRATK